MAICSPCGLSAGGTSRTNPAAFMRRRTSLMYAGLHPRTLRAYRLALDRFLKYVNKHRLPLRNARSLDKQLAEFIDLSYQEGEPISYAGHLMSAIKRFHPQLRFVFTQVEPALSQLATLLCPLQGIASVLGPGGRPDGPCVSRWPADLCTVVGFRL